MPSINVPVVHCRHCGQEYTTNHIGRHEAKCLHDPEVFARVRAALDDGTGGCIRIKDYEEITRNAGNTLPWQQPLISRLGSWAGVAHHFGLRPYVSARAAEDAEIWSAHPTLTPEERAAALWSELAPPTFRVSRVQEDEIYPGLFRCVLR